MISLFGEICMKPGDRERVEVELSSSHGFVAPSNPPG
jgi:hypothetical protein